MYAFIRHPQIGHPAIENIAWALPALLVLLLVAGTIARLLTGSVSPDVIGADGLGGTLMLAAP